MSCRVHPAPMFLAAARVIAQAVDAKAFPGAVVEVGDASRALWREAFGTRTFNDPSSLVGDDTIFDLASLTKVLATTPIVIQQTERGSIGSMIPSTDISANGQARIGRTSLSGICCPTVLASPDGRRSFVSIAGGRSSNGPYVPCRSSTPRAQSVYSDLGFMLLGFILDNDQPLAARFDALRAQMGIVEDVQFNPPSLWLRRTAATEIDEWRGRLVVGEVRRKRPRAWGRCGPCGLFGTAAAVGQHARHLLQILEGKIGAFRRDSLEMFITRRSDVPNSSRALGWDTMLPSSSCGGRMSPRAFGHTGFRARLFGSIPIAASTWSS